MESADHGSGGNVGADSSNGSRLESAVRAGGRGAVLAKQLPTGSALVFQILYPITTSRGHCHATTRIETLTLISLCAIGCILPNFTDSFRDRRGNLHYGIATLTGISVLDRTPPPADKTKYRIRASDLFHALNSLVIFLAVVLYSKEVLKCFFDGVPEGSGVGLVFRIAPVFVGIVGCVLFVMYPSERRGVGFPVGSEVRSGHE